jgi:hypothetical protein
MSINLSLRHPVSKEASVALRREIPENLEDDLKYLSSIVTSCGYLLLSDQHQPIKAL